MSPSNYCINYVHSNVHCKGYITNIKNIETPTSIVIEQSSQDNRVIVPLIGGGDSGLDLPKQKSLEFMLLSITLNDKLTLIKGLEIVLHQSVKSDVTLNVIQNDYETLEN